MRFFLVFSIYIPPLPDQFPKCFVFHGMWLLSKSGSIFITLLSLVKHLRFSLLSSIVLLFPFFSKIDFLQLGLSGHFYILTIKGERRNSAEQSSLKHNAVVFWLLVTALQRKLELHISVPQSTTMTVVCRAQCKVRLAYDQVHSFVATSRSNTINEVSVQEYSCPLIAFKDVLESVMDIWAAKMHVRTVHRWKWCAIRGNCQQPAVSKSIKSCMIPPVYLRIMQWRRGLFLLFTCKSSEGWTSSSDSIRSQMCSTRSAMMIPF